ncbi:MAG: type II toxin-antitoxin system VapC family toxin [Chloroflexi bacterium]|nr:type II toxin-antitoxin system VapC family toxin [Chloroflexota bacterium]
MICVDASVAAKWIFPEEPLASQAEKLYQDSIARSQRLVAPALLPIEVTNIIRQRMRRDKVPGKPPLSLPEAQQALQLFLSFPVEVVTPPGLHELALSLATSHNLSAVYDAHYLALAHLLSCPLWTADQNLVNTLSGKLPFLHWIGQP